MTTSAPHDEIAITLLETADSHDARLVDQLTRLINGVYRTAESGLWRDDRRERGLRAMQLELLVPREWRHPSKEFLASWYSRRGYRLIRTGSLDDAHPHLAPPLATPCDVTVYEKPLQSNRAGATRDRYPGGTALIGATLGARRDWRAGAGPGVHSASPRGGTWAKPGRSDGAPSGGRRTCELDVKQSLVRIRRCSTHGRGAAMDFHVALTEAAKQAPATSAEIISVNEYIDRVAAHPSIAATAHQRIHDMIQAAGSRAGLHSGETSFDFFSSELFGLDVPLERVVSYFETAAQGHETRRRILLLWGPPGGAKSTVAAMLKRGLEAWSHTTEGAVYALQDCPMHEEPLHLVPAALREQARQHTGVKVEGGLCPVCQYRLDEEFGGDFLRFPVERVHFSEARRVGIGTFEPGDPKSMSMEQLTGGMDWKAIERYGSDAHPLALDWQGEFSKCNRGVFEAVELLKNPAEFRNLFLTMAQEKQFKVAKFGYIDCDCAIVAHTNEAEFRAFMADPRNEALKDRLVTVAVPYNVRVSDEERIYRKLLTDRNTRGDLHLAPESLRAAAMVAILSRLNEHENLGPVEKMKLYDGIEIGEWKLAQIPEIKRAADHEGMTGLGPRRIVDILSGAAQRASDNGNAEKYLTPIMALIALTDHIERMEVSKDERERLQAFVVDARKEVDRLVKDEVRKAFVPAFAEHAQRLLDNYLTNIEAYCQGTRTKDPITKEDREPDEKLMRAIEEKVSPTVAESAKDTFRQGVLMRIGIAMRNGERTLSYKTDTILASGIEDYLFDQLKDVVQVTVSRSNPDQEQAKRLNEVTRVLCEQRGYNEHSARDLLDYVGHLLNR